MTTINAIIMIILTVIVSSVITYFITKRLSKGKLYFDVFIKSNQIYYTVHNVGDRPTSLVRIGGEWEHFGKLYFRHPENNIRFDPDQKSEEEYLSGILLLFQCLRDYSVEDNSTALSREEMLIKYEKARDYELNRIFTENFLKKNNESTHKPIPRFDSSLKVMWAEDSRGNIYELKKQILTNLIASIDLDKLFSERYEKIVWRYQQFGGNDETPNWGDEL